jgi:predicted transcriptional regulator
LELECLKALWTLGEGTVKGVRAALAPSRNLAYTTVMTLLDRLARKGVVTRRKIGRAFVYSPVVSRESVRRAAVEELVRSLFEGSEEELLEFLSRRPRDQQALPSAVADGDLDPSLL